VYFLFQSVSLTEFKVCLKDIQPYNKHHDPVTVSYMAIGCKLLLHFAIVYTWLKNVVGLNAIYKMLRLKGTESRELAII